MTPVVPVLFEDHGLVVGSEDGGKGFLRLVLQFEAVNEEEYPMRVS